MSSKPKTYEGGGKPIDGWLERARQPVYEQARFIERIRRPLRASHIDVTLDDSKAYTNPDSVRVNEQISPDDKIIEFIPCEN